ncbi:hypothetical protein CPB85DRAFT_698378 [Mucidula mucida]|nr:hypothetical protein CPB85DRAFT_698378 [Mucidula mucida]
MTRKRALSSDLDDGSDYEVPKPSKRTKTKVSSKNRVVVKGKGRKKAASGGGALQRLPAELILEITSYLPPEPLVALMFLCRLFYDILSDSSPASLKMWKHARSNETISVPPPPSDVTELQWARFLYEKHCQFCGPGPKKKLTRFFSLRKRVCAKCIAANLVSARPHIVLKKIPFASEEVLPLSCFPIKTATEILS